MSCRQEPTFAAVCDHGMWGKLPEQGDKLMETRWEIGEAYF
jgi:hypothetical protein